MKGYEDSMGAFFFFFNLCLCLYRRSYSHGTDVCRLSVGLSLPRKLRFFGNLYMDPTKFFVRLLFNHITRHFSLFFYFLCYCINTATVIKWASVISSICPKFYFVHIYLSAISPSHFFVCKI